MRKKRETLREKVAKLEAENVMLRKQRWEDQKEYKLKLIQIEAQLMQARGENMAVHMDNTRELMQLRGENRLLREIFQAITNGEPIPIRSEKMTAFEILQTYLNKDQG